MDNKKQFQSQLKERWDDKNKQGIILFRSDTLKTKTITQGNVMLQLVHNSSRDVYDKSVPKSAPPQKKTCPFCGELDNELLTIAKQNLRILGNKFACMQYQCLLVPLQHQETLTQENLKGILEFAFNNPEIVFLYNSPNAGKTVPHLYWLMSFHPYQNLTDDVCQGERIHKTDNITISRRFIPSYSLEIKSADWHQISELLYKLIEFMGHKNYNIFIYNGAVHFIPREDKEIPDGFGNHRFGGLEMIGTFIMKSEDEYNSVDPDKLLQGISQINFTAKNRKNIELFLISGLK